jgi:mxaJ protein
MFLRCLEHLQQNTMGSVSRWSDLTASHFSRVAGDHPSARRNIGGLGSSRSTSRRFKSAFAYTWLSLRLVLSASGNDPAILHVAADPNNLPFSNERGEGFENKIVELIARDLNVSVEYTWRAQRRGFFRETMKEGSCDLVAGVPRGFDPVLTTAPYYRSVYVLVQRANRAPKMTSLDDPVLPSLTIGVQMIGDDFANTPPAHALAGRGMTQNIRGYSVYGDYRQPNPPARIVEAVLRGDIDLACVWGPLAGYFAREAGGAIALTPLPAFDSTSQQPFAFDIAMGVRRGNSALRDKLNAILVRRKPEIDAILAEFGVPRLDPVATP